MMESRNRQMSSLTMITRKCGCIVNWQDIDSDFYAWIVCRWIDKARREDTLEVHTDSSANRPNDFRPRDVLLLSSAE
ncbi:hypothetical protein PILCRDRAFT_813527 [Piloderma croceum F 1598]|uniref:Uncharacterized protein n=1 Tax=Piloderma croceum (strain F 1598) TaxID=765440 RepID=A0A0C3CFQ5_PILCF|nr:hypothetical protein PILCRDRAFT_813527 [Piloderma croceum F 1598]